jgi:Beta-lactamase superfamily domain
MDFLTLDPNLSLWLVAAEEEEHCGGRPGRYAEAGSGQKIFYEPLSITQDLVLEAAFAALGKSAPNVEEARATFLQVKDDVGLYELEASGDLWHIRNRSRPTWSDPLATRRWVLLARSAESDAIGRVVLDGHEVKDALAWLPLLDGRHTEEEITRAAQRDPAGARVLQALEAAGGLVAIPDERFAIEDLPELLFVSHSSVFVRGDSASILVDPAILTSTELLSFEGRRPFQIVSSVDALIVSHCHWDHLSFQTMVRVPRDTTIFVPRSKHRALVSPPLKVYLEAFGFEDVREVDDWEKVTIGDLEVTFVPFFGEPFGLDSRFDAFTYLIRTKGRTIYGSLDACHDEAGTMDPVLSRLGEENAIDVFLFGSSAQKHDPLYRAANMRHYSNELVGRPDLVRYHPNVDDVARWCGLLRPNAIIPYASFVYFGAKLDDTRLGDKPNGQAYWASLGERAPSYAAPWRSELERLARSANASASASLIMLHPLQGLRLGSIV